MSFNLKFMLTIQNKLVFIRGFMPIYFRKGVKKSSHLKKKKKTCSELFKADVEPVCGHSYLLCKHEEHLRSKTDNC